VDELCEITRRKLSSKSFVLEKDAEKALSDDLWEQTKQELLI
jgi:hypothetical protein